MSACRLTGLRQNWWLRGSAESCNPDHQERDARCCIPDCWDIVWADQMPRSERAY